MNSIIITKESLKDDDMIKLIYETNAYLQYTQYNSFNCTHFVKIHQRFNCRQDCVFFKRTIG